MNLIDILTTKTIVENDDEWDEMEEHGAKQGEIIRKFVHGLPKLLNHFDEDIVGDVLFDTTSAPSTSDGYKEVFNALVLIIKMNGVDLLAKDVDHAKFIEMCKKVGLSRGEAMYILDQR